MLDEANAGKQPRMGSEAAWPLENPGEKTMPTASRSRSTTTQSPCVLQALYHCGHMPDRHGTSSLIRSKAARLIEDINCLVWQKSALDMKIGQLDSCIKSSRLNDNLMVCCIQLL